MVINLKPKLDVEKLIKSILNYVKIIYHNLYNKNIILFKYKRFIVYIKTNMGGGLMQLVAYGA